MQGTDATTQSTRRHFLFPKYTDFGNDNTMTSAPLLSGRTQKQLLEDATLLGALNKVPERPDQKSFRGERSPLRKLTPEREQQLASSFAYLSATTDDMLRVTAACVEEDADNGGITIRVASNTGDLSETKKGLEKLAASITAATDTTLCAYDLLSPDRWGLMNSSTQGDELNSPSTDHCA